MNQETSQVFMPSDSNRISKTSLRVIKALEVVTGHQEPISATQLADRMGVNRISAYRALMTLVESGFLVPSDRPRHYQASYRLLALTRCLSLSERSTDVIQDVLRTVASETQAGCYFCVLEGDRIIAIQHECAEGDDTLPFEIGELVEAAPTAIGRAILAFQPKTRAAALFNQGLVQHTEQTLTDPSDLTRELADVRDAGFAVTDRQYHDDLRCLAVPVLGHCADRPTGLTIHCQCSQFSISTLRDHSKILLEQSQRLAAELSDLSH